MARVTSLALRRSKLVIGLWGAVVLACLGLGLISGSAFAPPNLVAPNTETERWTDLTSDADFGTNVSVLLTGPEADLREQGTMLASRLRALPGVRVVSPYDKVRTNGVAQPRTPFTTRKRNTALFAVDVSLPRDTDPAEAVPLVRGVTDRTVEPPVSTSMTGAPAIGKGLSDELHESTKKSELIAAPILMLVLLLIFRSPVAAAVPLVLGFGTVQASRGIIQALATQFTVDQMALNLASMMALALGVDYSLLLASRYREYRSREPAAVLANIEAASRASRRTIVTAATLVLAVMAIALVMSIGPVLQSVALGVIVATVFGALTALVVAPALLHLLDPWFDRWRLPDLRRGGGSRFAGRQPIAVPIVALLVALLLAAPTLALAPGAPDVKLLPKETSARADYEQIGKVVGPGLGAMFDIAIRSRDKRPLTKRRSLRAVAQLQRRIGADPGIASVIGPGLIETMTRPLDGLQSSLDRQSRGLMRLRRGLAQAADGSVRIGAGAAQLHDGAGAAHRGAERLVGGIRAAAGGSRQLAGGIAASSTGSERLASGSRQASAGAGQLSGALDQASAASGAMSNNARVLADDLQTGADQLAALDAPLATTEQRLDDAWKALQAMTSGKADPQYQATLDAIAAATVSVTGADPNTGERPNPSYEGIAAGVGDAAGQIDLGLFLSDRMESQGQRTQSGVANLARGAKRLNDGIAQLEDGSARLSAGLGRLTDASGQLPEGLGQLSAGAGALADGLGQIDAGSGQLAARIGAPDAPDTLANGLDRMHGALDRQQGQLQLGALNRNSPNVFTTGSFPLAVVNGVTRPGRERAQFVLDLSNGGRSARILAVPVFESSDPRIATVHDRISKIAAQVETPQLETAVGGPAAALQDFKDVMLGRLPLMIAAFALVSLLVLMVAVRSVPLAVICVVLNMLTVAVAFGAMQMAFGSSNPLLGGPGYVDLIAMFGALAVVFALSIDYQVFLLSRIREEYSESHDNERAIDAAIGSTASVITGAAAVMVAVFLASGTSSHIGVREVCVGLAVAVLVDATVVRLILLPAAMRLFGERVWWFPGWLDRRLPDLAL